MLNGVSRGQRSEPRLVLYGPAKIGKTTFASQFPAPIIVCTEDGAEGLSVDRFPKATTWQQVVDNLTTVGQGEHDYETVVLDTLNGAAELAAQHVCATLFGGDWGPKGFASFGQGNGATSEEMRRLLPILDACRDRSMNVVLLAHTGLQSAKDPVQGDYQKYAPDMDRRIWGRFAKWADMIGRAEYEYVVLKADRPGAGRVKGTSTRIVHWSGSAAEDAGTRAGFEMPDTTLLSYEAFAAALGLGTSTLEEVKALWHLLDKEQAAKAMAWLGAKTLDGADTQKLKELLNRLRALAGEQTEGKEEGNG
jgi:hypothetical protein